MTDAFKPALGTTHAFSLPLAKEEQQQQLDGADDDELVITFSARPTVPSVTYQVWTNLPSDNVQSWAGQSWRDVTFEDKEADVTFPPPEAEDWPLLALSDQSPPLVGPAPVLQAVVRIPLKDVPEHGHFEYTYRRSYSDGRLEWLGDGGSNGKLEISRGAAAPSLAPGDGGRWKSLASKAFTNGASSATHKATKEWSGGPGRLGISVGPGAEWAGFGLSFAGGEIVPQLLPGPRHSSLPVVVVVHPVQADPPIFQVSSSLVAPGAPHLISATDACVACADDPHAEPSFFDFGEVTKKDLVLQATDPAADAKATMTPLAAVQGKQVAASGHALTPLKTSGSIAALYHPSKLVVYSQKANLPAPVAVHAPASLTGTAAVYSARMDDIALLEAGKGVLLDLPKQGGAVLESLEVAQLRQVVSADGQPSDVLLGPLKAASETLAPEDEVGQQAPSSMAMALWCSTSQATDLTADDDDEPELDDGDGHARDATDDTDDTMVSPAEPPAPAKPHAAALAPKESKSLFEGLLAFVLRFWSGVLGIFGCGVLAAAEHAPDMAEPTERTPLLAASSTDAAASIPARTAAPALPQAPASPSAPKPVGPSFARLYLASLPAGAILSVPSSAPFPTRLRLVGRPLGSVDAPFAVLVFKEGKVEEIAKDKDGRGRRFWHVTLGAGDGVDAAGEWEAHAWMADA